MGAVSVAGGAPLTVPLLLPPPQHLLTVPLVMLLLLPPPRHLPLAGVQVVVVVIEVIRGQLCPLLPPTGGLTEQDNEV